MNLECPRCGDTFDFVPFAAGTVTTCKWCQSQIRMPALSELPPKDQAAFQREVDAAQRKSNRREERTRKKAERAAEAEQAAWTAAARATEVGRQVEPEPEVALKVTFGPESERAKPQFSLPPAPVVAIVVMFFCIYFVLCSGITNDTPSPPTSDRKPRPNRGNRDDAWLMSQKFAKDRLKAPDTAKFPRAPHSAKRNGDKWVVVGQVTAKNPFGVPLRHAYSVVLSTTDGKLWHCHLVLFDDDLKDFPL